MWKPKEEEKSAELFKEGQIASGQCNFSLEKRKVEDSCKGFESFANPESEIKGFEREEVNLRTKAS